MFQSTLKKVAYIQEAKVKEFLSNLFVPGLKMERVLEELKRIEEEGKEIISEASEKSEEIISVAHQKAEKLILDARKEAESEVDESLKELGEEMDEMNRKVLEACESRIRELRALAAANADSAMNAIFRIVIGDKKG